MRRGVAIRAGLVSAAVIILVLAGAAPAMAGKGPKKQVGSPPQSPGRSEKASAPKVKGSPPSHARANSKPARSKPGNAKPTRTKPAKDRKAKGRRLARGHDKARRSVTTKKVAPGATRRTSHRVDPAGTAVLGLRVADRPSDETVTEAAGPGLFPRPAGEALPYTGGDIAAMLFIGLMVITIGGLIWRAPSLIDKPRRSRDLSV